MKKTKWILFVILACQSLLCFSQITVTPSSGCAPLTGVAYQHPYVGALNVTWDFGDGASSNADSPVHTYSMPGEYTVTFSAIVNGSPLTETFLVSVFANPTSSFLTGMAACEGQTVQFTSTSTTSSGAQILEYDWAFGDGGTNTNDESDPTYVYINEGSYPVSLTITDSNGCTSNTTVNNAVSISPGPSVIILTDPDPPISCSPPLVVTFTNNSVGNNLEFFWDFGGGQTSNSANPGTITFLQGGSIDVTVTVTDANNCVVNHVIPVLADLPPIEVSPYFAFNDSVCSPVYFDIETLPGNVIEIDYGDGTVGTDTMHVYNQNGWVDVIVTADNGNCQNADTLSIYVEYPQAFFELDTTLFSCLNPVTVLPDNNSIDAETYYWLFPGNTVEGFEPPLTITLPPPHEFDVIGISEIPLTLNALSTHGCISSHSVDISITLPTALHYPDTIEGCAPLEVTFSDYSVSVEPIISYDWYLNGDNTLTTSNTGQEVTVTYDDPGTYNTYLVIENDLGCVDTSFIHHVLVGQEIEPELETSPLVVCPGEQVSFSHGVPQDVQDSIDTWIWDGPEIQILDFNQFGTYTVNLPGVQYYEWTLGYNGCYVIDNDLFVVKGGECNLNGDPICYCEEPFTLEFALDTLGGALNWDVDFGDGTVILATTDLSFSHVYVQEGSYLVTITTYSILQGIPPTVLEFVWDVYPSHNASILVDTMICADVVWEFTSNGTGAGGDHCKYTHQWDFGDGTTMWHSDLNTVQHTYEEPGQYEVTLWTQNHNGCPDSAAVMVEVFDIVADLSTDVTEGCFPLGVQFTDQTVADLPIGTWVWEFGDDLIDSIQNPYHTYMDSSYIDLLDNNELTFDVLLTVIDTIGCEDTASVSILPIVPNFEFTLSDNELCVGQSTQFSADANPSAHTFLWDFGNGTSSTEAMPTVAYNESGAYDVTLNVDSAGCSFNYTLEEHVLVQDYPIAGFYSSMDSLDALCYPITASFTDTSLISDFGSRTWDLGTGQFTIADSTVGTIYGTPGTYEVSLIMETSFGCADTVSHSYDIDGPIGNLLADDDLICKGEVITFHIADTVDVGYWVIDFGDGFDTLLADNVSHQYLYNPIGGETFASATFWSPDSVCAITSNVPISIHEVIADFSINGMFFDEDTTYCYVDDPTIQDLSENANVWEWTVDGVVTTSPDPPEAPSTVGEHYISLNILNQSWGCVDTTEKMVTILPLPDLLALGGIACEGDTVGLFVSGAESYIWINDGTLINPMAEDPLAIPLITSSYEVFGTDSNACVNSTSATAFIINEPPEIMWDTTMVIGEIVAYIDVSLNEYGIYEWIPDQYLSCSDCPNPGFQPLEDIIYEVIITDSLGCWDVSQFYEFEILPYSTVDVPGAFTPNGDGVNDIILVNGHGIKELLEFSIYNRWGEKVFETNDISVGWDGYYKQNLQNIDTYAYTVKAMSYISDEPLERKGFISLMK